MYTLYWLDTLIFSMQSTHAVLVVFIALLALSLIIPTRFYKEERDSHIPGEHPIYLNPLFSTEERIHNLLGYMTLEEKIAQMALVEKNSLAPEDLQIFGIGALLSGAGAKPENNTPEGWKEMIRERIHTSTQNRLHIPILYGVDAIHGHGNVPGATIFPHAIGLGAAHDPLLTETVARMTGEEIKATYANWSYSPNLDLPRDIRWGRVYESFSDDPTLTSMLGEATVKGLREAGVLGTAKHYIGGGSMEWNSSSNENFRIDQGRTEPSEEALRNEYLPPFRAAVGAGVESVMVGLNSWGDTKLAAQNHLITDILKGELGFTGFVVSDWYGVYEIPGGDYAAAVTAINAGVDMVMLPFEYKPFIRNVARAVRRGDIEEDRIDDAVRRILRAKFNGGLFDAPASPAPLLSLGSTEHRAVAREAVEKSLVLLKNDNGALPITKEVTSIRVAGSGADNVGRQTGAWTVEWQGIDGNWLEGATSILDGIRARAGRDVSVEFNEAGIFKEGSTTADIGIAIVSEPPYAEGWGDRELPILSTKDREAIKNLALSTKKIIVIIVSGRPLLIEKEVDSIDALVAAWLPGSEGAEVADVLFGDVPFTGTLPLPWPLRSEQLPMNSDGMGTDGSAPLFPRFHGLVPPTSFTETTI
jgi:beta-glucosidase